MDKNKFAQQVLPKPSIELPKAIITLEKIYNSEELFCLIAGLYCGFDLLKNTGYQGCPDTFKKLILFKLRCCCRLESAV